LALLFVKDQSSHDPKSHVSFKYRTKGTIKSLTTEEICHDEALNCPIILGNTYHLALQPGTELIRKMGGLHKFMQWNRGILTDSGGFQMVSLLKLAEITEEGVTFENPFDTTHGVKERMLLRPEDSITHQNNIGSDIIMALDDVVSSVTDNHERFEIATYRTLRWLDRCVAAHKRPEEQNLFAIVQGGLDTAVGGLREKCLAGFRERDQKIPGYAIGGLAGGESKDEFWRVVDQCCRALPDDKPRYLMGVGYPLDIVICTALGVDMFDCVYPTRTARFGVALVPGEAPGTLRLKSNEFSNDHRVIMQGCKCTACKNGYTRARLHTLLKRNNPTAATLMTNHNIAYMMHLIRGMRQAIIDDRFDKFVLNFIEDQFRGAENGGEDVPQWVCDALIAAGISLKGIM
jgi:queuine tRNA-ribosyltransferase